MNNSSNSVFTSFFIYRILQKKIRKIRKNPKNLQKNRKIRKNSKNLQKFENPKKIRKIRKNSKNPKKSGKSEKNPRIFFEDLKFETLLRVNNPSNSVFKSFFSYRFLVHQKKFEKSEKIRKIRKKSKNFFWGFQIFTPYWKWTTPRFQCLNPILFIKSSYTQKNPEKIQKIRKIWKKILKNEFAWSSEQKCCLVSLCQRKRPIVRVTSWWSRPYLLMTTPRMTGSGWAGHCSGDPHSLPSFPALRLQPAKFLLFR